jgi:hypothetical protein
MATRSPALNSRWSTIVWWISVSKTWKKQERQICWPVFGRFNTAFPVWQRTHWRGILPYFSPSRRGLWAVIGRILWYAHQVYDWTLFVTNILFNDWTLFVTNILFNDWTLFEW